MSITYVLINSNRFPKSAEATMHDSTRAARNALDIRNISLEISRKLKILVDFLLEIPGNGARLRLARRAAQARPRVLDAEHQISKKAITP